MTASSPEYGEIICETVIGHGVRVLIAPKTTLMSVQLLRDGSIGLGGPSTILIANQVLYRIVGWEPEAGALILELVHDYRPMRRPKDPR